MSMMTKLTKYSIFALSLTNLSFFGVPGASYVPFTPFLFIMPILVIIALWEQLHLLLNNQVSLVICTAIYVILLSIVRYDETKWSSVIFFICYLNTLAFFASKQNILSRELLEKIIKLIMLVYFINVVVTVALYHTIGISHFLGMIFQISNEINNASVRYQGFSSEPSYAAFIIITCFYVYLLITIDNTKHKLKWFILICLSILLFGSSYGYLLLLLLLTAILVKRLRVPLPLVLAFAILSLMFLSFLSITIFPDARISRIILNIVNINNVDSRLFLLAISSADSSAFVRTGPLVNYFLSGNLLSLGSIFGHGAGNASSYFLQEIQYMVASNQVNLGFLPAFPYDFGLVGMLCLLYLIRQMIGVKFFSWVIVFAMCLNANINTQLFCFVVSLLCLTNKVLIENDKVYNG